MKLVLKIVAGILLASLLLIGGCAALIGGAANEASKELDKQQAKNAITKQQYAAVKQRATRASVEKNFGKPEDIQESDIDLGDGKTMSSDCIYYNAKGGTLGDMYQFCFEDGRLSSKSAY
jgi:hypothetical protein